jgi:hypothetical protein
MKLLKINLYLRDNNLKNEIQYQLILEKRQEWIFKKLSDGAKYLSDYDFFVAKISRLISLDFTFHSCREGP